MKKIFLLILILMMSISLFAQDTEEAQEIAIQPDSLIVDSTAVIEEVKVLSEEEKLSQKAAEDIMAIYDNYNGEKDYNLIYPRIKGFVDDFYKEFSDFNIELIERAKDGEILSDYENRSLVAYKGLKESVYDEISRFVSMKNFYWGYMDDELANNLKEIAKTLGNFARSNQNVLLKEQEVYVKELLDEKRKCKVQLDSIIAISDVETSLIDDKRNELIDIRTEWVEEKRITLFDLMSYESRRVNKIVSEFLTPLEEGRNIEMFDIDDDLISAIKNSEGHEELIKEQIKYKYYSALAGKFGFYIQFDFKPVLRTFRINVLVGTLLFMVLFVFIFVRVKKNKDRMFIRRIPGLDAIDDAIGRATEMGKPIVYDSGVGGYTNIDTIASMLILRSVAKKVAEFKAEIYFPAYDPIIMQMAEEMVASGFLDAGYPEDHKKDNIFFLAADQFAYAAGIAGILSRKKPATAFHFGYYAAESLLISEAGFTAGAIQVAGTTAVAQLPFFITACDYTLIGEELYAAAAYISRDAQILTNLKLSDFAKVTIGFIFVAGTLLLTMNSEWTFIQDLMITR